MPRKSLNVYPPKARNLKLDGQCIQSVNEWARNQVNLFWWLSNDESGVRSHSNLWYVKRGPIIWCWHTISAHPLTILLQLLIRRSIKIP